MDEGDRRSGEEGGTLRTSTRALPNLLSKSRFGGNATTVLRENE